MLFRSCGEGFVREEACREARGWNPSGSQSLPVVLMGGRRLIPLLARLMGHFPSFGYKELHFFMIAPCRGSCGLLTDLH